MASEVEIKLSLKDELTAKIGEVAKLFDALDNGIDLSGIDSEIAGVETALDSLATVLRGTPKKFNPVNEVDLSTVVVKIGKVTNALGDIGRQAALAQSAVSALRAEIASLKGKTIYITIITVRKTVTAKGSASGGVGASGEASTTVSLGSNPYGPGGGMPTFSPAQAKDFTQKHILPSLKTLGREGKVEEIVP